MARWLNLPAGHRSGRGENGGVFGNGQEIAVERVPDEPQVAIVTDFVRDHAHRHD